MFFVLYIIFNFYVLMIGHITQLLPKNKEHKSYANEYPKFAQSHWMSS